ncbi:T9SS type A sorting domain-containing protein [bacterium]|nr:T9SS type A sorting domain-containing protein [bacterium]
MKAVKDFCFILISGLCLFAIPNAMAFEVTYTLENVLMEEGGQQMFGTFTWTYDDPEEFENGVGVFSYLEIPFTNHDHTDLLANFDLGNSIELTLPGSTHDDGVDITLFLVEPLTPTTSASVDLDRSRYEIGGNGFHTGVFLSGSIVPQLETGVGDESVVGFSGGSLSAFPNPFNPKTTLSYTLARSGMVSLSVYDSKGRHVADPMRGVYQEVGEYSIQWRGQDSMGQELASGFYFARLAIDDFLCTRKIVLLK